MRICIYADNSSKYIDILLDIWSHGDCAVLIDPRIPFEVALDYMIMCEVEKSYIDVDIEDFKGRKDEAAKGIEFFRVEKEPIKCYCSERPLNDFSPELLHKEALILFSSGTTGRSKGIVLDYYSIEKNAKMIIDYMHPDSKEKIFIVKSLAHSSTIVGELLVALKTKMKIVLGSTNQHMGSIWNNIRKHGVTIICLNPTLLHLLTQYLSHITSRDRICDLKKIYTSGSIINKSDIEKFHEIFRNIPIFNVYGLTEAGPRVTAQRIEEPLGSVGQPIGDVKIVVTDLNGKILDNGKTGIVSVKTDCRFVKYIVSEEKQFRKSIYKDWINTGDLGYIDSQGNLFILGRADRMIVCGSHNVYPEQVEDILLKLDDIDDCFVHSVYDDTIGNKLVCLYEGSAELDYKYLLKHCAKYLAPYEIPKEFIYGKIPRTSNGKKKPI
jgi:long-chain acyl-CoA synthetase